MPGLLDEPYTLAVPEKGRFVPYLVALSVFAAIHAVPARGKRAVASNASSCARCHVSCSSAD
eukprot:6806479-Pyramimonas_sp.AAC.1